MQNDNRPVCAPEGRGGVGCIRCMTVDKYCVAALQRNPPAYNLGQVGEGGGCEGGGGAWFCLKPPSDFVAPCQELSPKRKLTSLRKFVASPYSCKQVRRIHQGNLRQDK